MLLETRLRSLNSTYNKELHRDRNESISQIGHYLANDGEAYKPIEKNELQQQFTLPLF